MLFGLAAVTGIVDAVCYLVIEVAGYLAVVESLHRRAVADETAKYMEFPRHPPAMPIPNADRATANADDRKGRSATLKAPHQ